MFLRQKYRTADGECMRTNMCLTIDACYRLQDSFFSLTFRKRAALRLEDFLKYFLDKIRIFATMAQFLAS